RLTLLGLPREPRFAVLLHGALRLPDARPVRMVARARRDPRALPPRPARPRSRGARRAARAARVGLLRRARDRGPAGALLAAVPRRLRPAAAHARRARPLALPAGGHARRRGAHGLDRGGRPRPRTCPPYVPVP